MADAIRRLRGREYKVKQAVGLYPTAGADDYAYSRHLVDSSHESSGGVAMPPRRSIRPTMRCGRSCARVTAGLLELDMSARRHKNVH
jgi:hypothetical protein